MIKNMSRQWRKLQKTKRNKKKKSRATFRYNRNRNKKSDISKDLRFLFNSFSVIDSVF